MPLPRKEGCREKFEVHNRQNFRDSLIVVFCSSYTLPLESLLA